MLFSHPFISLLLFAIVAVGANKIYKAIVAAVSKTFKSASPRRVQHVAFTVVAASIMLMAAPLLIPFGGPVRGLVMLVYLAYVGCGLWQVWSWYYGRDNVSAK